MLYNAYILNFERTPKWLYHSLLFLCRIIIYKLLPNTLYVFQVALFKRATPIIFQVKNKNVIVLTIYVVTHPFPAALSGHFDQPRMSAKPLRRYVLLRTQ